MKSKKLTARGALDRTGNAIIYTAAAAAAAVAENNFIVIFFLSEIDKVHWILMTSALEIGMKNVYSRPGAALFIVSLYVYMSI